MSWNVGWGVMFTSLHGTWIMGRFTELGTGNWEEELPGQPCSRFPVPCPLVSDEAAAHDADGLAGLVFVGGLRTDHEHLAEASFALRDVADLHRCGEDVAGANFGEVLEVGAAVEDALKVGLEAERFGTAWGRLAGDGDRMAEEARRRHDRAITSGLSGGFVVKDGVRIADGAGEMAAAGGIDLVGYGVPFPA